MINLGQYVDGTSAVHRMDPRVKIAGVVVLSIVVLNGTVLSLILLSAFLLGVSCGAGLPFLRLGEALRPVMFFLALLFLLHLFSGEGRPIPPFPAWRVTVTYEGLREGAMVTWRFALLVAWGAILTMTTPTTEMAGGIEGLLRPLRILRVPSHEIAFMISMAMRFVPVLQQEMDRVRTAQLARGANLGAGSLLRRARKLASLMWPVVLGTLRRADRLATAIEARGYTRGPRTCMRELRFSPLDLRALVVIALVLLLCRLG